MDKDMPPPSGKFLDGALSIGLLFLVLALGLRVLFVQSMPGAATAYNPYYMGDTSTWLEYAGSIQETEPFDLGLPLRPPGVAYLVALLWNGQQSGLQFLKLAWSFMGATTMLLFFVAVSRSFDFRVAAAATLVACASSGLMVLSTSINNETPYLLLVIASFTLWESIRYRPRLHILLAWAILHGLACLIRVEHVLFFSLVSAYLVWAWARSPGSAGAWTKSLWRGIFTMVLFALPLMPWQLHIVSQIERFNNEPLPLNEVTARLYLQLELALSGLRWSDQAVQERLALPAFSRRPMSNFVAATVAVRGGNEVRGEDFGIIEQAFGSRPEPINAYPFVALYGGLNFYLANNPRASGGFKRDPLELAPPLVGGPARYPRALIMGLPPPDLALSYPPHLELVNHGYRLGWDWILNHPGDYLALALKKLNFFWGGATLGFTGYNLPLGMSGIRRSVDMVVPEGGIGTAIWRWGGFVILLLGLWIGRRDQALVPWLLLLTTKVVTTLAFFGYAREGAVVTPVLALLLGLVAARGLPRLVAFSTGVSTYAGLKRWLQVSGVLALVLIAIESYRYFSEPVITLDGQRVTAGSPFPEPDYEDRRLQVK